MGYSIGQAVSFGDEAVGEKAFKGSRDKAGQWPPGNSAPFVAEYKHCTYTHSVQVPFLAVI